MVEKVSTLKPAPHITRSLSTLGIALVFFVGYSKHLNPPSLWNMHPEPASSHVEHIKNARTYQSGEDGAGLVVVDDEGKAAGELFEDLVAGVRHDRPGSPAAPRWSTCCTAGTA
ncbi:hypothetical protein BHM03_00027320 [Ensete ventricosum]|nr:hypothetical protein BHM03_00027320 [Ensete ventricosum]